MLVMPLSGSTKPLDLLFINWIIGTTKKLIQSPSKKHGHSTIQILFKIVLAILKKLFSTLNHLLKPQVAPLTGATEEQCNNFMTFFRTKIAKIRSCFSVPSSSSVPTADLQSGVSRLLCCFPEITQFEVGDTICNQ